MKRAARAILAALFMHLGKRVRDDGRGPIGPTAWRFHGQLRGSCRGRLSLRLVSLAKEKSPALFGLGLFFNCCGR